MPAKSKSQQRLMGWVYACKQGKAKNCPSNIKKIAKGITTKDAKKFAETKHKGLPEMENKPTLLDFLQEMGNEDGSSKWALGGDAPKDTYRPSDSVADPAQDEMQRRQRINSEIKPQTGDLIQTSNSNYIVLGYVDNGIKLREIKTNKIGVMPLTFRFEKTSVAPNGNAIFRVSK